jgi:hypothetical protein
MNDFVSAGATHEYVRQLEARVAALEELVAALSAPPPTDRREYMREYMARKRAAQRASDVSTHDHDTASPNA